MARRICRTRWRRCRGCDARIYWVKTDKGRNMPIDCGGVPHWVSCPNRDQFKRGRKNEEGTKGGAEGTP
jgi:hypothetical protein